MRNMIAVGVAVAILVMGGLMLTVGDELVPVAQVSPVAASRDFTAGALNGNVPTIAYDTQRAYTMIVLPPGAGAWSQRVLNTFASDPIVRAKSIVRLHNADASFVSRWGGAFPEASAGNPVVCVLQEAAGQVRSVYKMPMTGEINLADELRRVQTTLANLNCPLCPKPNTPTPTPTPPAPSDAPTMPPLANTPPGTTPSEADDNKAGLILIGIVALVAGAVAYYRD